MESFDIDFTDFVDFSNIKPDKKNKNFKYKDTNYDNKTIETYRVMRQLKLDPITCEEIEDSLAYKYPYVWDPISGQRTNEIDPFGPLCFNPINLAQLFYANRLDHLWHSEIDEGNQGGIYEGYYGVGLGAGKNFNIIGRGEYPEYYIWRLPINDCYLHNGHKNNIPTKGPELSRDDIIHLYDLCLKCPKHFWSDIFITLPNLVKIYDLYNRAIDADPDVTLIKCKPEINPKFWYNKMAVDELQKI